MTANNRHEKQNQCQRCGTCCRKGGPAFHLEDRSIIEEGIIALADLYTIREGEPAYDNVSGQVKPVAGDIIKIKSHPDSSVCRFYNRNDPVCTIYDDRPLECRVLKCWDIKEIAQIYDVDRLDRKTLLENMGGLMELVVMHQQECAYAKVDLLVKENDTSGLSYMLRYDRQIRELTIEKTSMDRQVLEFLFGEPLTKTIRRFGIKPETL